jgi:RND superfamily putative drug exporter
MVAVFGAFAISGTRVLEMFGFMMATAVFLDAIVIRMLLLPAVLELLGRTTWMLPSWLDRRLPRVAIEAAPGPRRGRPLAPALDAES